MKKKPQKPVTEKLNQELYFKSMISKIAEQSSGPVFALVFDKNGNPLNITFVKNALEDFAMRKGLEKYLEMRDAEDAMYLEDEEPQE